MNIYNSRYNEERTINFDIICFARMEINRVPGLMTDKRINMDYVPDDVFAFEVGRNSDGSIVVSNSIDSNFFGTFITKSNMGLSDDLKYIKFPSSSIAYLCHEVVFGKDYNTFFEECT